MEKEFIIEIFKKKLNIKKINDYKTKKILAYLLREKKTI
jgi:hypothetical protein